MTVGHLLFAALMTSYILVAIVFEERNLVEHHGRAYRQYRSRTGKLLPRWRMKAGGDPDQQPDLAEAA
jgi:protein-S-isoprenylcysteine O-methyltransferase Ste14